VPSLRGPGWRRRRHSPARSGKRPTGGVRLHALHPALPRGTGIRIHLPPAESQERTGPHRRASARSESYRESFGVDPRPRQRLLAAYGRRVCSDQLHRGKGSGSITQRTAIRIFAAVLVFAVGLMPSRSGLVANCSSGRGPSTPAPGRVPRRLPGGAAADPPASPGWVAARSRAANGLRDTH
jgi:hypothetical protein